MKQGQVSVGIAIVFYAILVGLAFLIGQGISDLDILFWHNDNQTSFAFDAILGAGVGLIVVAISQVLDRKATWARELGEEFRKMLGPLKFHQVFIFAVASGVAEELFFRGFLQQLLSVSVFSGPNAGWLGLVLASLIFGGLHIGPDTRKFWPWTAMAVILGGVFGLMYMYTGNVLAPVVAHFTINFFNLFFISQKTTDI